MTTTTIRPSFAPGLFLILLALVTAAVLSVVYSAPATAADWTRGYAPCEHEDSPGPCYWDAQERGNGAGRSFVVEPAGDPADNDDDTVIYVSR